jgi:hypothetical protein
MPTPPKKEKNQNTQLSFQLKFMIGYCAVIRV